MNSKIKSILRIIFFFLIGIILAGVLIPFVYKDKIVQYLKQATNKNINATVDFKDADISVFSSFPSLRITIDSLSVVGQDTFDGIVLYASPETAVDLNLASLFGKNKTPEINKLYAYRPEINIVILDSLRVNYLIQNQKEPQTASQYKLTLKSYEIKEGKLTYQDNTLNLFMALDNCNHKGKGDFTQDVFDLFTETNAEKVHVRFDGTEYLNGAKANLIADLNLNFPENKYTLINNSLQINDFDVQADGFFQIKNEGIYNDITFKTASESFKSFLSLVPGAYTKDFSNVKASGNASLSGFVKGIYNSEKSTFPAFDIQCVIKNGSAKYPDLPQELKNIQVDINTKSSKPNLSDFSFAVPMIKLNIGNDPIEGKLLVTRVTSDQNVTGSDADVSLKIHNPLSLFTLDDKINADFSINSGFLDLNEWMQHPDKAPESKSTTAPVTIDDRIIQNSGLNLNIKAGKILFNDKTIENININGTMAANAIQINELSAKIQKSDIRLKGKVINVYDYLFNNNILDGELELNSDYFDANQFLVNTPSGGTENTSAIPVPDRVRIQLHTQIKELLYTNLQLKDFQGILEVKNKEVAIKNVETNALGGKMYFDGLYNTTDLSQPDFAVKLDLSKIAFAEAISKIDMFKKVAPIAAYINGLFNTSIVMRGKLGGTMMPDLSTLDASGMIETLNGAIKGSNPMAELAQKTGIKELSEIDLANSKNWFEIIKGFMELKPYTTKIKGVNFTISGKHGFGKEMDYKINLVIPREILKKNKILGVAEAGLSNIEKEAGKLGINIQQGPEVFLDVLMTGPFKKPNFKIMPRNSQGSTYTDAVESKAKDIVKNVTDSVKSEIKKKETELRDTITKRANEELEKVKSQVEKTADKAIDSIKAVAKDQVISRLDTLTKGVISDSLKQKAKDILDKKSTEEVDKIKEKLKDFNPFKKKKEGGG
ncbi:MAG: hypothetical protein IPJ13_25315 [Saprospiraceae bacterium]|nr:hypothetical protein [Saprospiraceae bacterium]